MKNERLLKVVFTGLFAALSYVVFTFLQIKISLPGGNATSINSATSTIVSVAVYIALRPALKKSGLFFTIAKKNEAPV